MARAFVAIALPAAVLDAVAARLAGLELRGAKPTTREQWHLTLQFLGDADIDAVALALSGIDERGGPIRFGGTGAFPRVRRANTLWFGVAEGGGVLARLAAAVGERLAPLGYEPDPRPFRAHLTLARAKTPIDMRSAIAALGDEPVGPQWVVEALTVYESELRREGARYTARASVALPA